MLVALFGLLFLGGGIDTYLEQRLDTLEKSAKTAVVDAERRDDAEAVLKEMQKRLKARAKGVDKGRDALGDLVKDHDATDAELEAVWDGVIAEVDTFNRDMMALRFDLKEHVTREEWAQLFPQN